MDVSIPGSTNRDPQGSTMIRLRGLYPSLKTALQKVANLILQQPEMAIYASVNEVAAAAQVSEATVMRFCRILGFKGFQDFKIALARELAAPSQKIQEEGGADDPAGLVRSIFKANASALENTLEVLDLSQLQQAVQFLLTCRRLLIIGVNGSASTAQYAGLRFTPLGLNVHCFTELYQMFTAVAILTEKDVVLVISHSGSTRETLEAARVAKDSGARVIAVTSNSLSPLASMADLVLLTSGRELIVQRAGLASFLCQIAIIDSLFALLQQARPEETRANLRKIEKTLKGPG